MPRHTVLELARRGILRVEDGNHGEYRPRPDEFVDQGVAFIRAADLNDSGIDFLGASKIDPKAVARITKGIGKSEDVILSHKGTVGKVALAPRDAPAFVCSPQTTFWRSLNKEILDQRFLYTFLRSPDFRTQLDSRSGETDMAGYVSLTAQRAFRVPLPPLTYQHEIVGIISAIDDKIDLNRRTNETLEAMVQAIFKDWFVDFRPTWAKMEGRTPYLVPELWDLFSDRLDDATGMPKGWHMRSVYDFVDVVYGAPFASSLFNAEKVGLPLIRIRDLSTHEPRVFTNEKHPKGHVIMPGDIVVGMDGEFRLHVWKGPESWLNQRVCHFEPLAGVPISFVVEALQEPLAFFERGKVGTTVIHLGKADIDTFQIVSPGKIILQHFGGLADPLINKSVEIALETRTLCQTRDILLPKLMSGEIRLRDAEKIIGESL